MRKSGKKLRSKASFLPSPHDRQTQGLFLPPFLRTHLGFYGHFGQADLVKSGAAGVVAGHALLCHPDPFYPAWTVSGSLQKTVPANVWHRYFGGHSLAVLLWGH